MTAQGSVGAGADGAEQIWDTAANLASESTTRPYIVPVQDSTALGKQVPVGYDDSLVGGQTGLYNGHAPDQIFGGVGTQQFGADGTYQPGRGRAGHFRHPNGLAAEGADEGRP
jgi:hypothetical protein